MGRGRDAHCGNVFSGKGVGCVGDEQTCLGVSAAGQGRYRRRKRLTLPTAPSPVTTHWGKESATWIK